MFGGLKYDQNGYVTGKYVEQGIINSLGMDAQTREAERQASVQQDLAHKEAIGMSLTPDIEQYSEERLSPDMLDEYR